MISNASLMSLVYDMSEIRVKLTSLVRNADGDSVEIEVSGIADFELGATNLVSVLEDTISKLTVAKDPDAIIKDLPVTKEQAVEDTSTKLPDKFICVSCGMEVTKIQKDVSMLFMNKIMCDTCMKSQPKER